MNVIIRKEEKEDYQMVYEVNLLAFQQENEGKLVEKIRTSDHFIPELSLVAEVDGQIVGHILFPQIQIVGNSVFESLALAPMAVVPQFQRKEIGGKLVKEGIKRAKELGFDSIIVLGHQDYYPRFGFQKASKWNIKCPFQVPDEAFMAMELLDNSLESKAGMVKYPDVFME